MLCSCNGNESESESSQTGCLNVAFDWSNESDANPQSVSLFLFPVDGGIPYRYDFGSRDSGTVEVKAGTYNAVCISNDEPAIAFRGEVSYNTFEVYSPIATNIDLDPANSVSSSELPRAIGKEEQTIVQQPPLLWSDTVYNLDAGADGRQLVMTPKRIVDTYKVTVAHINNAQYLYSLNATVSDLADGYFPGVMTHNGNQTTIPHGLSHNVELANAEGMFYAFGHCAETPRNHKLMLYAILTDGRKYYYEYDVTNQMHLPADADNIRHITVDLLDLPESNGNGDQGSGLGPNINDWEHIDIDLPM